MNTSPRPSSETDVAALVAERAAALALDHPVRIAIDGPPWSGLELSASVTAALAGWSRPVIVVSAADFLRPASVRLEQGRDDPDAFHDDWIDLAALEREVLAPCATGGTRRVLPTLWDAARDRATRADYVVVPDKAVVIVDGWLMLGRGLSFDLTVHIAVSAAARARRVPDSDAARELPAFTRYDEQTQPTELADIVVRADDPRRPAVIDRTLLRSRPCPPT